MHSKLKAGLPRQAKDSSSVSFLCVCETLLTSTLTAYLTVAPSETNCIGAKLTSFFTLRQRKGREHAQSYHMTNPSRDHHVVSGLGGPEGPGSGRVSVSGGPPQQRLRRRDSLRPSRLGRAGPKNEKSCL